MLKKLLLPGIVLSFCASTLFAITINVPADYSTIQTAIDSSSNGDTVLVQPGTYVENIDFLGKDIKVISSQGAESTIINPENTSTPTVYFQNGEPSTSMLIGFTLSEGNRAVFLSHSSGVIKNCILTQNTDYSIICSYSGNVKINNCVISNNSYTPLYFTNCISSPIITNCTIVNNTARNYSIISNGCIPEYYNCILYNNSGDIGGSYIIEYSLVEGGYFGKGNFDSNPIFVDKSTNFHLSDYSPCIGAGLDTSIVPTTDLEGNPRPNPPGTNPDIGAYENSLDAPPKESSCIDVPSDYASIQAALNEANEADTVLVQPGIYYENIFWPETYGIKLISAGDTTNTIIDGAGNGSVIYINPITSVIDTLTLIKGFKIQNGNTSNGGGICINNSSPTLAKLLISNNSASVHGGGVYSYEASPIFSNVSITNNSASSGGGVYSYHGSSILSNVSITNNSTGSSGGGIYVRFSSLTFSNVSITNNSAGSSGGGMYIEGLILSKFSDVTISNNSAGSSGGGMYITANLGGTLDSPFSDVTISNNSAGSSGGGICIFSQSPNPTFSNVTILNNQSNHGGGVYFYYGSAIFSNVTILNNSAETSGGGAYIGKYSYPTFSNVTILNNSAETSGGGAYIGTSYTSNPTFSNVTITNNRNEGIYVNSGNPVISQSNISHNGMGLYNYNNTKIISVTNNYWGHSSGPYHPSQNPTGQGDSTNLYTNITPWLTTPNSDAPPIPIQNVKVTSTGNDFINLEWDASPLTDLAGYKVCFKTDTSEFFYTDTVDAGTDTSYSMSGLPIGTTYYLSVICHDQDGNESWYSKEVVGTTRIMEARDVNIASPEDVMHVTNTTPSITWNFYDSMGEIQTNYQIQVSTKADYSLIDMWDTGQIGSSSNSITYEGCDLLDGQTYYLRIRLGSNGFWNDWSSMTFRMNSVPSQPQLLSPIENSIITVQPTLKLFASSDAESDNLSYNIYVYDNQDMLSPIDSVNHLSSSSDTISWIVTQTLTDNNKYWWKAKAYDGFEYGEYSDNESFIFNIQNDTPAEFTLVSPQDSAEVSTLRPTLIWNPAYDPDPVDTVKYTVYLDTPEPGIIEYNANKDTVFMLPMDLSDNTIYYWKVVATDLSGATIENTGGYQSFMVNTANDYPGDFALLAPEYSAMVTDLTPEFIWESSVDPDILASPLTEDPKNPVPKTESTVVETYQFYLSNDSTFATTTPVEVTGTKYTPETELTEDAIYYWKVTAVDSDSAITSSARWAFWTNHENSVPDAFVCNDADVDSLTATLSWQPSSDIDLNDMLNYTVFLGKDIESLTAIYQGPDTSYIKTNLEDNTTYYWKVVATDLSGATRENTGGYQSFTVNTANDVPGDFALLAPANEAMVTDLTPDFIWENSVDPDDNTSITNYLLFINNSDDFSGTTPIKLDTVKYQPLSDLLENEYYFWKVEAIDKDSARTSTEIYTFWTNKENSIPGNFELTYPTKMETINHDSITFQWDISSDNDIADSISYSLLLGSTPETIEEVYFGKDTSYTALSFTDNSEYYWKVIAKDLSGATQSNIGNYNKFFVNIGNDNPTIAEPISPDSVIVLTLNPKFTWKASTDPDPNDSISYKMRVWNTTYGDSVITDSNSCFANILLSDNSQYTWDVVATDKTTGMSQSGNTKFWTDLFPEAPAQFNTISPINGQVFESTIVDLLWNNSKDPDPLDYASYTLKYKSVNQDSITWHEVEVGQDTTTSLDLVLGNRYEWQVIAKDDDGFEVLSDSSNLRTFDVGNVSGLAFGVPEEYTLTQNYPNPFNPSTTIEYGLPTIANTRLMVFDLMGRKIKQWNINNQHPGWHEVIWDGTDMNGNTVSTGVYIYSLRAGDFVDTKKMVFMK